ncbi:LPXTG cell wall anchor domain-containing protein [Sphingobacterium hotanense]|jgi:hypothetical protein|uniref:LPXTG cell wall anchor domain-containing protein n=1 Tax=Sphingobacterium hotanense TaxID=649196 RepID=A0ABT7NTI2_9SPHI|nr:LPXTG cell wall anchor domain-containing protein [Sphingobacterium hotanense]MCT1524287.1 LPXTG cell wall anchor domain-containing protein [Sphingobacterium hotanense]MDM1050485.1 LPXTG cell wall anchor domain-containing protein [Sphingobacterium hotanense]
MRKWNVLALLNLATISLFAQDSTAEVATSSNSTFVVIGVVLLVVVIFMLYRKQKRKFND